MTADSDQTPIRWPRGVSEILEIPETTLEARRSDGDAPRLYGIGRALLTTRADVIEWLRAHELKPGETVRPATVPKGSKRRPAEAA